MLIGLKSCLYNGDTELACAVDVVMARAKRIYILITKVNKLFFLSLCLLKEIENMYSMFLSSYRNTPESLGELEKAAGTPVCGLCFHNIVVLPNFHLCFYLTNKEA